MTRLATYWWEDQENILLLAQWMADEGYEARALVEMLEKPWHWDDEWCECVKHRGIQ